MTSATPPPSRTTISIARDGDGRDVLTLAGDVDDHASLAPLAAHLGERVTIDLGGVRFINSVGVREWIGLLEALAARGAEVVLREVSEPMVRQMTMVMEARGDAAIASFAAPYVCGACGDEASVVLEVAPQLAALRERRLPAHPCPSCGAAMEFDEFPNRYLAFLD